MSAGGSNKAIIAAFLANLGISIAKFIAFLFTGATSMLAESVHSLADTGNQALLLLGGKRSKKTATPLHQFGFGRERYFWSFVVAIVLFTVGAMFAMYEGVHKIQHPEKLDSPQWAFGVLIVAIGLESYSFRTAIVEANRVRGKASWSHFIRRSKAPELPVVLLEDFGALIGLVLALSAVSLTVVTGNPVWDGYGTLSIGLLLFVIAIVLAIEMKSLLIGEAAAPEDEAAIKAAIETSTTAESLIHLRTEHIGPDEVLVVAKVAFPADMRLREIAAAVDEIEASIRVGVPEATLVFIEPDIHRGPAV